MITRSIKMTLVLPIENLKGIDIFIFKIFSYLSNISGFNRSEHPKINLKKRS